MLHLFKNVYVATDNVIDVFRDRVVISQTHGLDILDGLKHASAGELIAYGPDFKSIIGRDDAFLSVMDMFNQLGERDRKVIIYCDDQSLQRIMAIWMKILFKDPNPQACLDLLESMVFKYTVFHRGRFSRNSGNTDINHEIDISDFLEHFENSWTPSKAERKKFVDANKKYFSVEPMIATYLASGKMKKELKNTLSVLLKKDLEKYMYELKEIFFAELLTKRFTSGLNLDKVYDFTNYNEVLEDESAFPTLFMTDRIWKYKYMNFASAGKNIHFENITEEDIVLLKEFAEEAGQTWSHNEVYSYIKGDTHKLDFVPAITDEFTDELLDTFLEVEAAHEHEAGSFFPVDMETVNCYFIQGLLNAWENEDQDFLAQYAII